MKKPFKKIKPLSTQPKKWRDWKKQEPIAVLPALSILPSSNRLVEYHEAVLEDYADLLAPTVYRMKNYAHSGSHPTMLTLSNIKNPNHQKQTPGQAELTIYMDYAVVTKGPGVVTPIASRDATTFRNLYSKGDRVLYLSALPSPTQEAKSFSAEDLAAVKSASLFLNKRPFYTYYEVNVVYDFTLSIQKDFTILDALQWIAEGPETQGVVMTVPFHSVIQDWDNGLTHVLNNLSPAELTQYNSLPTVEEQIAYLKSKLFEKDPSTAFKVLIATRAQLLVLLLEQNPAIYQNKHLLLDEEPDVYNGLLLHPDLQKKLTALQATLHIGSKTSFLKENASVRAREVKELSDYPNFVQHLEVILKLSQAYERRFNTILTPGVTAAALSKYPFGTSTSRIMDQTPINLVILNHHLLNGNIASSGVRFKNLPPIPELIAHEAGHNAADTFLHSNPTYSTGKAGLSSTQPRKVYPTESNTLGIINDPTNRSNMTIK